MLTKAIKAEIKDLYDGSFASIRETSILFKVDHTVIMYFLDYKNQREKQIKASRKWQEANPEKVKISNKRACKRYYWKNKLKKI